jgi:hypothetical protein
MDDEGHGPRKTENSAKQYKGVVLFLLKNLASRLIRVPETSGEMNHHGKYRVGS